jgi:hypothetical protein
MNGFLNYSLLMSTNGAVSLMQTDVPTIPPFGVILADGELLDTFTDKEEACEFYDAAQHRLRAGLRWPDPDAPAVADVHPGSIAAWASQKAHKEAETVTILPCGCYADACHCGQYPTQEDLLAMQAGSEADQLPMTAEDIATTEWTRNFTDARSDQ